MLLLSSPPRWPASTEDAGSVASFSPLTTADAGAGADVAPERVVARANGDGDRSSRVGLPQRSVLGVVLGALAGAVGLKLWEGLVQRLGGGGGGGGGGSGSAAKAEVERGEAGVKIEKAAGEAAVEATVAEEEAVGVHQARIQALEDQLAVRSEGGDFASWPLDDVAFCVIAEGEVLLIWP